MTSSFGGNLDAPGTFLAGTETQLDAAAIFAIFERNRERKG